MDFLATIMDHLSVDRPSDQRKWAFDGKSILPILRGEMWPERGIGWMFHNPSLGKPYGYRYGKWKYVHGSTSCGSSDCQQDQLYDLEADLGEKNDIGSHHPDVLAAIKANFTEWYDSVMNSRATESLCGGEPTPAPTPPTPLPPSPPPSHGCDWQLNTGLDGRDMKAVVVDTKEDCCDLCKSTDGCVAADFNAVYVRTGVPNPDGVHVETMEEDLNHAVSQYSCHLKNNFSPKARKDGSIACVPSGALTV